MEEEEPMDISGEERDYFSAKTLPSRFTESLENWNLNATVCSSSPTRSETRHIGRSISIDVIRNRKDKTVFTGFQRTISEDLSGNNSIRSLTSKKRHSLSGPLPKKPRLLGPGHPDYKPETGKQKEKPSLFRNTKGKFILWAILIGLCFAGKLYLSQTVCELFVDIPNLERNFDSFLFGQHIARNVSISTFSQYWEQSLKTNHSHLKPIIFSFHGWTGVGKNFVTKIILNSLHTRHTKMFLVPMHFPSSTIPSYAKDIIKSVRKHIRDCRFNVFIFDEMDKAPPSLIKGLKSVLISLKKKEFDRQWIVFIFLSNSKGTEINNFLFTEIAAGRKRDDLTYEEIVSLLHRNSEKEWYHELHKENLIDIYVPFLPLNKTHVEQCIKQDLRQKKRVPSNDLVQKIVKEMSFFHPAGSRVEYSLTGCKRVHDKVDLHITSVD
ncbi:torsin-1A-like [Saccostrea cucullata]|uniref:torsin-1A-like n=1 Tax=Saccostrea cuccullata TaxID=36930 RepID=UPI002ED1C520